MENFPLCLILDSGLKSALLKLRGNGISNAYQFYSTPVEKLIEIVGQSKSSNLLKPAILRTKTNIENLSFNFKKDMLMMESDQNARNIFFHIVPNPNHPINRVIQGGSLTELLAPCGYGKTTIIINMLINHYQLTQEESIYYVYVDCNGLMNFERVKQIVQNNINDPNNFLDRIHYYSILDYASLNTFVRNLKNLLSKHLYIVIFDGLLCCFNSFSEEIFRLQASLFEMMRELNNITKIANLPILISNSLPQQDKDSNFNRSQFDHYFCGFIENRLQLVKYEQQRYLQVKKSGFYEQIDEGIQYKISDYGVEYNKIQQ